MTISNPNKYSEMGNAALGDIRDDEDFPHVGIIKALSVGLGQNYAFGGYNASSITDTSVTFAGGKVMRDGKLVSTTGATLTISDGSSGTGDTYYLAVIPDGSDVSDTANTITKRTPSKRGVTPAITSGDIIVAVMVYTGTNPMTLQYLTVNKTENHLSIATDSSGYTEVIKLEATGTTTATITGAALTDISPLDKANDRLLIRDATNNQLKLVAPDSVGGSSDSIVDADSDTKIQVEESADEDIIRFDVAGVEEMQISASGIVINEGGNDRDIRIEGSSEANLFFTDAGNNRVGIGTNSPAEVLSVSGNIRSSGDIIVGGALDHNGSNISFFATAAATKQTVGNLASSGIGTIPSADPTIQPGFEPGTHAYIGSLESEISGLRTKLDALIDALQLYGLIS